MKIKEIKGISVRLWFNDFFRNEETEEQKVHYDLSKVTQSFNDTVIQKFPFLFIMRFRDVQNAMFNYQEKMIDMSLLLKQ